MTKKEKRKWKNKNKIKKLKNIKKIRMKIGVEVSKLERTKEKKL